MAVMAWEGSRVNESDRPAAGLYCSTSGACFGPLFQDYSDADGFLSWLRDIKQADARRLHDAGQLEAAVAEWRQINAPMAVEV